MFVCNAPADPDKEDEIGKSWGNFWRSRDLGNYYVGTDSIASSMKAHPTMNWRYVVKQANGFSGLDEVNLDGDFTWSAQLDGR